MAGLSGEAVETPSASSRVGSSEYKQKAQSSRGQKTDTYPVSGWPERLIGISHIFWGGEMDLKAWRELAPEKKKFVIGIAVAVAVVYLICILLSVNVLRNNRVTAELNHQARMSSLGKEQGDASSALAAAAGNVPTVWVGTYVDGIDTFSIKDSWGFFI